MRITLLGIGLIGGSIARALRTGGTSTDTEPHRVAAWTPGGQGPEAALAAGVIDEVATDLGQAVRGADLVVLAAPPLDCLDLLDDLGGAARRDLAPGVLMTDVASTKSMIVDRAASLDLPFVGGHPMAGIEASGFGAADARLFAGRPWLVVPGPSSPDGGPERVAALARACGARPVTMSAADHDAATAAISHLPLVLAAALVEAVAADPGGGQRAGWDVAAPLAASGWDSMTRLARGDVEMATGIVFTNARPLAERLRQLVGVLDDWLAELDRLEPDADRIRERFARARDQLEAHRPGERHRAGGGSVGNGGGMTGAEAG
jgi:prephenate dehydrogenase